MGHIFKVDVEYFKYLHDLHNDLPFSSKRMKIKKCQKLFCNFCDLEKYVVHIRTLKKLLYTINREASRYQPDHQVHLMNMNILQIKDITL